MIETQSKSYHTLLVLSMLDWPFTEAGERNYKEAFNSRYTIPAIANGKAIGFLIGTIQIPPANAARSTIMANLNNIYVEESARKQGAGAELFENFKKFCQENRVEKINVTVNSQNNQAIDFYKKHGFTSSHLIMTNAIQA